MSPGALHGDEFHRELLQGKVGELPHLALGDDDPAFAFQGFDAEQHRRGARTRRAIEHHVNTAAARDLEDASDEDHAAFAAQLRTVFLRPAPLPDLAWMSRPGVGGVVVDIPTREGVQVSLQNAAGQRRGWSTDGTGFAGSGDIPPGDYTLVVNGPAIDDTPIDVQVQAGRSIAIRFAPGRAGGSS